MNTDDDRAGLRFLYTQGDDLVRAGLKRFPDIYTAETDPNTGEERVYVNRGLCPQCHTPVGKPWDRPGPLLCADCAAIRARQPCPDCGYHYAMNGDHRADCITHHRENPTDTPP
jgi:hypothetical protein